jgi:hypothetical protein
MPKTELEIQNEIRARNGMLPLTELAAKPETEEQKQLRLQQEETVKKAEEERLKIEANQKQQEDTKKADEEKAAKAEEERLRIEKEKKAKENLELDDDTLLKQLQKRNPKIKSFEDLAPKPTAEEIEQEKENREADKLSWGLKTGRFKKKELEGYIQDSKNAQAIIFDNYSAKVKQADPTKTDEEIKALFEERYGIDQDPESWQYKQGQEELSLLAEKHIQKNYGSILSLENEYSVFEKSQNERNSLESKVLANAAAFKRDVEDVFSNAATYRRKIGDHSYEIPLPTEFLERTKSQFLTEEFVKTQILAGWDKQSLQQLAENVAIIENQDYINQKIAEQYHLNHQKGTRGIAPDLNRREAQQIQITDEKQQKAAERHGAVVPATT